MMLPLRWRMKDRKVGNGRKKSCVTINNDQLTVVASSILGKVGTFFQSTMLVWETCFLDTILVLLIRIIFISTLNKTFITYRSPCIFQTCAWSGARSFTTRGFAGITCFPLHFLIFLLYSDCQTVSFCWQLGSAVMVQRSFTPKEWKWSVFLSSRVSIIFFGEIVVW